MKRMYWLWRLRRAKTKTQALVAMMHLLGRKVTNVRMAEVDPADLRGIPNIEEGVIVFPENLHLNGGSSTEEGESK